MNYNGVKEVSYRYNKTGDLVSMTDWLGTSAFELDLLHQLTAAADHKGNRVEVHLRRRGQPDRPNVLNQNPILANGKITTDANFNITGKAANGRETFEIILIETPIYQYMLNEYETVLQQVTDHFKAYVNTYMQAYSEQNPQKATERKTGNMNR